MIKKIDAVKYKANDYRVDKKGKRTPSKFAFWVRAGGAWTTAAESGDERAEQYRGVFSADVAAVKLPDILVDCGLMIPAGVSRAANEAAERIAAKALKLEKRERETVEKGREAYLTARSESAIKSWDRLLERVEERAKAQADAASDESATDAASDESAADAASDE